MANKVLFENQRQKQDNSDDSLFYKEPRFVHHLDESFRRKLTGLYENRLQPGSQILDLMSSWVSHLPNNIEFSQVIGHGLNEKELKKNQRLDNYWIQDLNKTQKLPLATNSLDACLLVAAWQYLQEPEAIAMELKRIIKPDGQLLISFSNRAFWSKAPQIWREGSDMDHIKYVKSVLIAQGWDEPEHIAEYPKGGKIQELFGISPDPFFSVIALNK